MKLFAVSGGAFEIKLSTASGNFFRQDGRQDECRENA
jgi:hypothetical protein